MADQQQRYGQIIQNLFLTVAWVSALACLVRTDFNFAFALFGYYLWISSKQKINYTMLLIMNLILLVVDIIWLLAVGGIWTTWLRNNAVWNSLHGLHVFSLVVSTINILIKIGLMACIRQHQNLNPAAIK